MENRQGIYAALAVVGALVPLTLIGVFIANEGLDFGEMADQVFGEPVAAALLADMTISSIVFWVWMWPQAERIGASPWGFVVANLFVGLSFALPLFLYVREKKGARQTAGSVEAG